MHIRKFNPLEKNKMLKFHVEINKLYKRLVSWSLHLVFHKPIWHHKIYSHRPPFTFLDLIDFIATCKGFLASVLQITPNIL